MPDTAAIASQQAEMYGEPLGARFGRLLDTYRISQARLAGVIGLSPPMLSQLMSGQRAKISNPAVFGRLVRLEELAELPAVQAGDADAIAVLLAEIGASRPQLTTRQVPVVGADDAFMLAARAVARVGSALALSTAAAEVTDERLAELLRAAAALAADDASPG